MDKTDVVFILRQKQDEGILLQSNKRVSMTSWVSFAKFHQLMAFARLNHARTLFFHLMISQIVATKDIQFFFFYGRRKGVS